MELTKEMLAKAKETKTVEELIALAKENGMELDAKKAEDLFAKLHQAGELSDDELNNVAGGGCNPYGDKCPKCGCTKVCQKMIERNGEYVLAWCCTNCGDFVARA